MGEKNKNIYNIQRFILYIIRLVLIISVINYIVTKNWFNLLVALTFVILTYLSPIITKIFKINLIPEFNIVIQLFMFSSIFLGTLCGFYGIFWWWDVFLHVSFGIIFGLVGFIIIYILNNNTKINLSLTFIMIFIFCFSVTIGVIWELYEFTIDSLFYIGMQKYGLIDTMWDLIADSLGAIYTCIIVHIYLKTDKQTYLVKISNKFIAKNINNPIKSH